MIGKTEPRVYSPPLRELTPETSLGFACVEYAKKILRKTLYPWQEWALIHSLEIIGELGGEWKFRFRTVLFLISRQNGKTVLSEVIASFFLNVLGVDSIFGTSLSLDKAEEVWEAVINDQESIPELKGDIDRVSRTNGNKRLVLTGLRQYKVGAPTRRAGRGDSNDLVMLDEIREQRDWETWSAAAASTTAKPNGLIVCFSNAGILSAGEMTTHLFTTISVSGEFPADRSEDCSILVYAESCQSEGFEHYEDAWAYWGRNHS